LCLSSWSLIYKPGSRVWVIFTDRSWCQLIVRSWSQETVFYMQDRSAIREDWDRLSNHLSKTAQVGSEFGKQYCSPVLHKENKLKACVSVDGSLIYRSGSRVWVIVSHDAMRQHMRQHMYTMRSQHVIVQAIWLVRSSMVLSELVQNGRSRWKVRVVTVIVSYGAIRQCMYTTRSQHVNIEAIQSVRSLIVQVN
jgi:hypothetical protein